MLQASLLLLLLPSAVLALEPERREAVVVHARVWDGDTYEEVFVPSGHEQMQLMSGASSALSFVRTLEYYWPLSRRAYVDFERQREEVEGTLRISAGGETVAEIAPQPYSILYPQGAVNGNARLLWGEDALAAREDHLERQRSFNERLITAQREHREYERALLESGKARQRGAPVREIPPPDPLPEPSLRLVTEPRHGYRVDLPPGDYRMELLAGGVRVPGTGRDLRVINATGRETLVADIIPEERWTRPIAARTEAARIYARPGAVFYLTLAEAERFRETEYLPVVSPQAETVRGREIWVRRGEAEAQALRLNWKSGTEEDLMRAAVRVEQTRGYGYRVRAAEQGEEPDLEAFAVTLPRDPAISRGTISGIGDSGFLREVVIVHSRREVVGLLLALLPLAALIVWRLAAWRGRGRAAAG